MKRFVLAGLAGVAVLAAVVYYVGGSTGKPTGGAALRSNVLLITIDTLRADRLRRGLTPNIDALAEAGLRFDNARATVPLTLPSHASIMTGTIPSVHGVHDNGVVYKPGPATIARVLRDEGYRTGAFVGAYVLNRVFGLGDGFGTYDDRVHRNPRLGAQLEAERRGGEVVDAALQWLGKTPQPFFLWVHLYDPHAPYDPPAGFGPRAGQHAYDGEVAYADAQVGRILSFLRSRGVSALVALAGDHGEGLGDHGEQLHGMLAYDSTLRVPLVLVAPGHQGVVARPVSLADLAAAIVTGAGGRAPDSMRTHDLFASDREAVYAETEYPRAAGWHGLVALADDRWKLIISSEAELYDLSADPGEKNDVAAAKPGIVAAMTKRALSLSAAAAPRAGSTLAPDAAERLRALGYVSPAGALAVETGDEPNPARVIESWTRFETALSDVTDGRAALAIPTLRELAAGFPSARVFHSTLARALTDTGDARAAVVVYRALIAKWPSEASLYHDLAVAARAAGHATEAVRAEQAALALDKDSPLASNGLGLLQAEAGATAAAAASFERAVAADPTNASYWAHLGNARRDLGDLDKAEEAYRRALDLDSAHSDAANGFGVVLVQRRRPAEAIALFRAAFQGDPQLYEAQLNLGIAYQESGDGVKAAETYRALLATAPASAGRERSAAAELLREIK